MSAPLFAPQGALRPLRPHQERALSELRHSLASGRKRPMLQAPTGFGKTILGAHIVAGALGKGRRVAFCVPRLTLIDQTVNAFSAEGIRAVGVLQGDHCLTDHEQPVQICSAQTLARRNTPTSISCSSTRLTSITNPFSGGWPTAPPFPSSD